MDDPSTSKKKPSKKWSLSCFVPMCPSNSKKFPNKRFLTVPNDPEIRKNWMKAAGREDTLSPKSVLRCCEDHFDLENDIENWVKYKLVGGSLIMKKDVVPHIFDCQQKKKKNKSKSKLSKQKANKNYNTLYREYKNNEVVLNILKVLKTIENEEQPLFYLIQRLVSMDTNKGNTILTNSQILNILQKEFHINVQMLHPLEEDIYINVLKRFLKYWPRWDEITKFINESKITDKDTLYGILEGEYRNLKKYLKTMLDTSQPLARDAVKKFENENPCCEHKVDMGDANDVVMEVQCTQSQLHQLFFKKPHPAHNNTIFNVRDPGPSKITLHSYWLMSILNWPFVAISITTYEFQYKREVVHKLQHSLINKKLKCNKTIKPLALDRQIQIKTNKNKKGAIKHDKKSILSFLEKLYHHTTKKELKVVLDLIKSDFDEVPSQITVPALYRTFLNKYAYVRYFQTPVEDGNKEDDEKYDLYLEEKLSPMCVLNIARFTPGKQDMLSYRNWLEIECSYCRVNFKGLRAIDELIRHFNDSHQQESDWICTNCKIEFSTPYLAEHKWYHEC